MTKLILRSLLVKASTLSEAMQSSSISRLDVHGVELHMDGSSASLNKRSSSLSTLSISVFCRPSVTAWLLEFVNPTLLTELSLLLDAVSDSVVEIIAELLTKCKALENFDFSVGILGGSLSLPAGHPITNFCLNNELRHNFRTGDHMTTITQALARNKTIQCLDYSLPIAKNNTTQQYSMYYLDSHILNNYNLVEVGKLQCNGLTDEMQNRFKAICNNRKHFIQQLERSVPVGVPEVLWPCVIERSLKSRRGRDAIFEHLRTQMIVCS